jgi:hypothetical protein
MVGESLDLEVLGCSQEAFQPVLIHLDLGITGPGQHSGDHRTRSTLRGSQDQVNTQGITGPGQHSGDHSTKSIPKMSKAYLVKRASNYKV